MNLILFVRRLEPRQSRLYVLLVPLPVRRYWSCRCSIRLTPVLRIRTGTLRPLRVLVLASSGVFSFAPKPTCTGPGGAGSFGSAGRALRSYWQSTRLQNRM